MLHLIPSFISVQYDKRQFKGDFQATTMFIDIAGFTAMTQALMVKSKEGAEVLSDLINSVFSPAISTIYVYDGFISSFAGDAFTAIFPSDQTSINDAVSAAIRIREMFKKAGLIKCRFGSFELSVKIGMSWGQVEWGIIRHERQNAYYFMGKAIDQCAESEHHADKGEVILDNEILPQISNLSELTYLKRNDRFYLLRSAPVTSVKDVIFAIIPTSQDKFIPENILTLNSQGEFRNIVSCFISFKSYDLSEDIASIITLAHRYKGYFNKVDFGDKGGVILVLFGTPKGMSNLFSRSLDFAMAVKEIPELSVRIGLAVGVGFTGFIGSEVRSEYTALGSVVNLSARFMMEAGWGEVFIDEQIHKQADARYKILASEPRHFKGFEGEIPVYRVTERNEQVLVTLFEGEMVGRDEELKRLVELLQPVKEKKFGGIVYVYGDAGIGKSRLIYELIKQQDILTLTLQTDDILQKGLNPFTYFFSNYFELYEARSFEERKEIFKTNYEKHFKRIENSLNVDGRTKPVINKLRRIESIIGAIIGLFWDGSIYDMMDPNDRSVATRLAIKEFFTTLSLVEPIIIHVEDFQWLDGESQTVFEILTRHIENFPLLILASGRLNDDGSKPEIPADENIMCHEIILNQLSQDSISVLIADRLGDKPDNNLTAYLFSRTEGNPFYAEQLCLYLQENNLIVLHKGRYQLMAAPADIPTGITEILIARIDRLTRVLKETVQIASVLGREFEVQVLAVLIDMLTSKATEEESSLHGCEIHPLIFEGEVERVWVRLAELRCIFRHVLIRDTAYDMQLRKKLRFLHKLAGDTIVKLYYDNRIFYSDIAYHYEQAEVWNLALKYCLSAGDYFKEIIKYDEALVYFQKALSICQERLKEKHPYTATSYNNIGEVFRQKGADEEAMSYHEKALAIRKELLGEKHPDTAQSYNNIGLVYHSKGHYDKALRYHEKALAIRKELLGEKHQDTALSYNNIGAVYRQDGKYDKALEYYEKALHVWEEVLVEKHPYTATSFNNIGDLYRQKGQYDIAFRYFEKALTIWEEVYGKKHTETANCYNNIGGDYNSKGDYDEALKYYKKALAIRKELLGENHPSTAQSYNNIGLAYINKGNYDKALRYLENALAVWEEVWSEKHPSTAFSYNNIGGVYHSKGHYDKALRYHEKALAIRKELLGEKHPDTAQSLANIASEYFSQGRYRKAEPLVKRALAICEDSIGANHTYTKTVMNNMVMMYESMGNKAEANKIRMRIL